MKAHAKKKAVRVLVLSGLALVGLGVGWALFKPKAPSVEPAPDNAVLKYGDSGEAVKTVQRAVGSSVDGFFGPDTEAKVKAFQLAHALVVDGIVGPETWGAIDAAS